MRVANSIDIQLYGSVIGAVGLILLISFTSAAIIMDGSWMIGTEVMSNLSEEGRSGGVFFNVSLIIFGASLLFLSGSIRSFLGPDIFSNTGCMILGAVAFCISGLGVFPVTFGMLHYALAVFCFILAFAAVFWISVSVFTKKAKTVRDVVILKYLKVMSVIFLVLYLSVVLSLSFKHLTLAFAETVLVGELLFWNVSFLSLLIYDCYERRENRIAKGNTRLYAIPRFV